MTPEIADWIAANVLTTTYIDACGGLDLIRGCECEFGTCDYCKAEKHSRCTDTAWTYGTPSAPHTYLQAPNGAALRMVWPRGKACTWRCACRCVDPPALTEQFDLLGTLT